jgi:hypothetical protein
MNHNAPVPPETIRHFKRKNWLWLLIVPPLLSLSLGSLIKPDGRSVFMAELAIVCLCSFVCGFALAIRHFKTFKQRIWGGIAFSGGGLYLISCVVFLGCIPIPIVTHQSPQQIAGQRRKFEEQMKENAARKIPPRDANTDASMLDLTLFYNSWLPGSHEFRNTETFLALQPGTHLFDEIKFDARGMILLSWVQQVTNISVGQKCSEIDFLHGAGSRNNSTVASLFVIHFANGHVETIPIIIGQDVGVSSIWRGSDETGVVFTNSIVWEERISTNAPPRPVFRLFIKKWNNPLPNETVQTIDFIAPEEMSTAFLVSITVRPTDEENK